MGAVSVFEDHLRTKLFQTDVLPLITQIGIELLPLVLTFFSCLFVNMEFGIMLGAAFHLMLLLHMGNKPKISVAELQVVNVIKTPSTESSVVSTVLYFISKRQKTLNLERGESFPFAKRAFRAGEREIHLSRALTQPRAI